MAHLFMVIATTGIPVSWNTLAVYPVPKKGDCTVAANNRLVWVMGPFAKLFMSCINTHLDSLAEVLKWHTRS